MIEIKVSNDLHEIASAVSANISATLTRLQSAAAMLATDPASTAAVLIAKEQPHPVNADSADRLRHLAGSEALSIIIDLISAANAGLHVTLLVNARPETTNNPGE